jgi:predicted permease
MDVFSTLFSVIAPVFLIGLIGYGWGRSGKTFDTGMVTLLVINIGVPCLIIDVLLNADLSADALSEMALAAFIALSANAVLAYVFLRATKLSYRAYLPSLIFGNTGNMGLPLCLFAFGEEGLALAIGYFVVFAVMQFTLGMGVASGRFSPKELARSPVIISVIIALAFMAAGIEMPTWADNTIGLLGGMTIPLMLLTLGVSLGRLHVQTLGRSAMLACVRLGLGFAVGWGAAELLGMEGAARGVVIVESAMPVAVFNYLFAVRYNAAPSEVAGMVVISTALSFATLPLLLLAVM